MPERPKLSRAFTQIVIDLAAAGHLITYTPFDGTTNHQPTWEAGKLFQAILNDDREVTPLLALGRVGNQLLAATIHPTTPAAILLDTQDALDPTTVIKTPLAGGNQTVQGASKSNDPKPFITKKRGNTISTRKVLPIQPEFLSHFLEDDKLHHPASLHTSVSDPPRTPNCDPTALWLQCATTKHQEHDKSTLAITCTQLSNVLLQRASDTIRNDLEELLSTHATQLLQQLETAQILAPSIATSPDGTQPTAGPTGGSQPTTGNPDPSTTQASNPAPHNTQAPAPPPAAPPAPAKRLLFHDPSITQAGVPPQPPHQEQRPVIDLTGGAAAGRPSVPTWPPPPQDRAWAPPHWHLQPQPPGPPCPTPASTKYPNPAYLPPPPHGWPHTGTLPPPPTTFPATNSHLVTPGQTTPWAATHGRSEPSMLSTSELAQNHIRALLSKNYLTADDHQRVQTFVTLQNATQSQAHAQHSQSDRIYALLGFAGLTPQHTEYFHNATNGIWREVLAESSKAGRENRVEHDIAHTLRDMFPTLRHCLHQEWVKAVANFDFCPQPLPPGEKHRLGPMAYVQRTKAQIHEASYQQELLTQASHVSTTDIAKAKLNTPIVPRSGAEVISTLTRMLHVLQFLFTNYCPLAIQLSTIIRALEEDSGTLTESDDFQWGVAAEIMWQVTVATQTFFGHPCSKRDHQHQRYKYPDLTRLRASLGDGTIIKSLNKPPMFRRPTNNNKKGSNTTRDSGKRRRTDTSRDAPTTPNTQPHVARLTQECANIITKFRNDHRDTRLPSIAQIRQLAGVQYDSDLITHLGLQRNDCIRYHFYGRCSYPGCARVHQHRTTSDKHGPLLTKAIAKAIASKS